MVLSFLVTFSDYLFPTVRYKQKLSTKKRIKMIYRYIEIVVLIAQHLAARRRFELLIFL
jgi:hypothetical protein